MNLILLLKEDFLGSDHRHVRITGRRAEHVSGIQRAKPGDELKVGHLNGKMGKGRVEKIEKDLLELTITLTEDPPAPLKATLILALPRPQSLKKAILSATSFGVKDIHLIASQRVEKSYWSSPVLTPEALNEKMILGLEQAKDTIMPKVSLHKRFKLFIDETLPSLKKGSRCLLAHPYDAKECPRNIRGGVTIAIGPEGGFIDCEVELLTKAGFEPVSLGERTLRVEDALPAMIGRIF